jgi:TetR/AcrR family transcriptional regulator, ethionamide resistance regulator
VSGEAREQAIVTTLRTLLAERSFHAISVDDLARGAGISRPTFYFYFAAKDAVLVTLLEQLVGEAQRAPDQALQRLETDPAEAWRQAIGAAYGMWSANRDVIRAAAAARTSDPEVRRLWADLVAFFVDVTAAAIEAERARGRAPAGIPAGELALCLNRMNEGIFAASLVAGEATLEPDRVLPAVVDVWLRAIYGTPPGAP